MHQMINSGYEESGVTRGSLSYIHRISRAEVILPLASNGTFTMSMCLFLGLRSKLKFKMGGQTVGSTLSSVFFLCPDLLKRKSN